MLERGLGECDAAPEQNVSLECAKMTIQLQQGVLRKGLELGRHFSFVEAL